MYIASKKITKREFKRLYPHIKQVTDPRTATFSIISNDDVYFPKDWLKNHHLTYFQVEISRNFLGLEFF